MLSKFAGLRRVTLGAAAAPVALALSASVANAQAQGDHRPAEQVFKNIQSLKGIPADEFMSTMGFFSASLGLSCGLGILGHLR